MQHAVQRSDWSEISKKQKVTKTNTTQTPPPPPPTATTHNPYENAEPKKHQYTSRPSALEPNGTVSRNIPSSATLRYLFIGSLFRSKSKQRKNKYIHIYYICVYLELLHQNLLRALVYAHEFAVSRGHDARAICCVIHAGEVLAMVGVRGRHLVVRPPATWKTQKTRP